MAIIAVALSVGLYFGLQDNSSGKNSTETGTWLNQIPFPDETENDTIADDKENDANETVDGDEEKNTDEDKPEAEVDSIEKTKTTTTTTIATTSTTTTTTTTGVIQNVGSIIAPKKYGCFSGSDIHPEICTEILLRLLGESKRKFQHALQ